MLILLFFTYSIITIVTLNKSRTYSKNLSKTIDPTITTLQEFEDMLKDSKMSATNWVFIPSAETDKEILRAIHKTRYSDAKGRLEDLFIALSHPVLLDSMRKEFEEFEELMTFEKPIMNSLVAYKDYNDPFKRLNAENILESEVLPRTEVLMKRLVTIIHIGEQIRDESHKKISQSSARLRILIVVLMLVMLALAIFLSRRLTYIITNPINEIRLIVNELAKGSLEKVTHKESEDEIGEMVESVNILSDKLKTTADFAQEIGQRNFELQFEPLSEKDVLGKSLITMRDNLKSSDERLEEVQGIARLGNWECDMKLHFKWSREMYSVLDYEPFKIQASYKAFVAVVCEEDKSKLLNLMTRCLQFGESFSMECKIITIKDKIKYVNIQAKRMISRQTPIIGLQPLQIESFKTRASETKIIGIMQDITEQKVAEEKIKLNEAHLRKSQFIARLGSWERDIKDSNKLYWSDEMYRIFEADPETYDNTYQNFYNSIYPEDREMVESLSGKYLKDHKPLTYEARIITKKGNIKTIYVEGQVVIDENGKVTKTYGIAQDITERKKIEQELRTNNFELKKTNMELDRFVYSVSHDLRAPLSSMLGVIEMSEEDLIEESEKVRNWGTAPVEVQRSDFDKLNHRSHFLTFSSDMQAHLKMLKGSIKKLDGFILDILEYSRNSRLEVKKEEINFKEILADIVNNLKYMGSDNRQVNITLDVSGNAVIRSDKSRLNVILNNIISNAVRYQNPKTDEPFVNIKVDTSDTETNIIVRDNGIGISPENHKKIFDMFYRVAETSVGSGLGLYIAQETIQKLNGHIDVESELGKGSVFSIHIPNS